MSQLRYLLKRSVVTILLIFGIMTMLFVFFRLMPGDYATVLAGEGASPEQIAAMREKWGLNKPIYEQYYIYLGNLLQGNVGVSRRLHKPVLDVVKTSLMNSFILALPPTLGAYVVGGLYGALLGSKPDSDLEKYGIIPPTIFGTSPSFFIGMVFILVFSSILGLTPVGSMASFDTYAQVDHQWQIYLTADFWHHYVLPFATILLAFTYYPALVMRSSVVETRGKPFMQYERLMGMKKRLRMLHTMKLSSLPLITLLPVTTSRAISGLVTLEIVFNWPGIGKLLVDSVVARDTPVIQFMFVVIAAWIIIGNFAVDIAYGLIDPRITVGGEGGE